MTDRHIEIKEAAQPVLNGGGVDEWECFSDMAYFDMWCVRRVGERRFGFGYHVPSEAEARALCAELQSLKSAETAEDAWKRGWEEGFWSATGSSDAPPYVAPGASHDVD